MRDEQKKWFFYSYGSDSFSFFSPFVLISFFSTQNEGDVDPLNNIEQREVLKREVKTKEGIVHRVFKAEGRLKCQYSVHLQDGKVFLKRLTIATDSPDDFFFLREGDTVVYSGDKVIEIRFKREAQ